MAIRVTIMMVTSKGEPWTSIHSLYLVSKLPIHSITIDLISGWDPDNIQTCCHMTGTRILTMN